MVDGGQFDEETGVIHTKDPISGEEIRLTPFTLTEKEGKGLQIQGIGKNKLKTEVDLLVRAAYQFENLGVYSVAVLLKNGPDKQSRYDYHRTGYLLETSAGNQGIGLNAGYLVEDYQTVDEKPSNSAIERGGINKILGFKAWVNASLFHGWSSELSNQTYVGAGGGVAFHFLFVPAFFAIEQLVRVHGNNPNAAKWLTRMRVGLEFGF